MITADTITDEQIRALRAEQPDPDEMTELAIDCVTAISAPIGSLRRISARARCAEILNNRQIRELIGHHSLHDINVALGDVPPDPGDSQALARGRCAEALNSKKASP